MTESTKPSAEHPIQVGGSPSQLLRSRGGEEEGNSMLPQVPDFLGYVLGLMLVWLLYTGYNSVVTLFTSPDSKVVQLGSRAKSLTQETANAIVSNPKTVKVMGTIKDATSAKSLDEAVDVLNSGMTRGRLGTVEEEGEEVVTEVPEQAVSRKGWAARLLQNFNTKINYWTKAAGQSMKGMFDESSAEESPVVESTTVVQEETKEAETKKPDTYESF